MAPPPSLTLDHAGFVVRDLDAGEARWQRLGFTLSPRSDQLGLDASGAFTPWASANHCAVFRSGYLELIGIVRPGATNPWAGFLERFEGAHIAALRCASADAAFAAIATRTDEFDPPVQRRREAPFFADGAWGTRRMGFRNVFSRDALVPECRYIVIEHQTPEVLWQPCLLDHPNGARTLESLIFAAGDPEPVSARLERLTGRAPMSSDGGFRFELGTGRIDVLTAAAIAGRFPGTDPPGAPRVAAVSVGVDDLAVTEAWLTGRGIRVHRTSSRLWVGPEEANGAAIEFTARSNR